jgi:hypothetical protein
VTCSAITVEPFREPPLAGAGVELGDLTEKAKSAPCGIWLDAEPVPPWEFRKAAA